MQSCSPPLCVYVLLSVLTVVSESAHPSVTVKLHESATLPCYERCSGVVRWTVFDKPSDVLAECDQTSCRSVKEGYQMIHDQYLKGNFSLTITDADFSKRNWYICTCDGTSDLCDVTLKMEPLSSAVQKKPGEDLVLVLDVSDPVEVTYNRAGAAGPSSGQICTVDGRSLSCKPEYTQRSSLTSSVELRGVMPSDSGVYTVMDRRNQEAIRIYSVIVKGDASEAQDRVHKSARSRRSAPSDSQPCMCGDQPGAVLGWAIAVPVTAFVALSAVSAVVITRLRSEIKRLRIGNLNK